MGGKGECKELCMAGNAPRSQCLRVPIMLNSDSTPDLTYELLLKQTSFNKFGRGWIMSADDGAYDRSILMDDSRFGGVALGVGRSYDAFRGSVGGRQGIAVFGRTVGANNEHRKTIAEQH